MACLQISKNQNDLLTELIKSKWIGIRIAQYESLGHLK